jgi:hypothetical protein
VLEITRLAKQFIGISSSTVLALSDLVAAVTREDHSLRSPSWLHTERHNMSSFLIGFIKFMATPELTRAVATIIARALKMLLLGM